ncbi:hypothetical protein EDC94DRAFT_603675 [Helicostylum pulchrum]|nr:hypothetical protein EDC94DRAFT_603675 [Helicostylum pulchrum]
MSTSVLGDYSDCEESDFSMNNDDSNNEEDNSYDDDDDDYFTDNSHKKKTYQVDFTARSAKEITKMQIETINQVSTLLELKSEDTATLLRYFKWNKEKLVEKYMDSPEKVLELAGISNNVAIIRNCTTIVAEKGGELFECDICCDDDPDMEIVSLACGHKFCKTCVVYYTSQKIKSSESKPIQCPQDGCSVTMDEKVIGLLVQSEVNERYKELLNRTYVDDNNALRWCPAPDCEYAIECHIPNTSLTSVVPTVVCHCGNYMCFGCGLPNHQPAICSIVKKWLRKCKDDSETANWISANTKECTKCQSTIEKNGGCNHMTCRKCRHEFCWVCMGPWSEHGTAWYNCNRFDESSSSNARETQSKSRASLERYLHYYNRFANHEQSAKLEEELYKRTEKKMEELQKSSDLSWIEVQFLRRAVDVTVKCRTTLKWTYVFAFYLEKTNATALFEDNQRDLEMATEQLSELLEKPLQSDEIPNLRQVVLDKSVYVNQRQEVLLEDTARGLQDGRWAFFVDINH